MDTNIKINCKYKIKGIEKANRKTKKLIKKLKKAERLMKKLKKIKHKPVIKIKPKAKQQTVDINTVIKGIVNHLEETLQD